MCKNILIKMQIKIVLIIALLLSGLLLFSSDISAKDKNTDHKKVTPVKFAFIPDTHVAFDQHDNWILYNESLVILQDIIKSLNNTNNLNFVVFGGDLVDNRDRKLTDMPIFIDSVSDLKVPYYVTLGDRDADLADGYTKEDFTVEFRKNGFTEKNKTYWTAEPAKNILLIGLDTSTSNSSTGIIPHEQLSWLEQILSENKDKFVIITMHHPAIASSDQDLKQPWKDFILSNSDEFLAVIKNNPQVKIVLSGHHHLNLTKKIGNTIFISAPSIVSYPNQFKILSIYPDRIEVENKQISYKQIIKKAKKTIINTGYARQFDSANPHKIIKLQEGDKFSQEQIFYFFDQKNK